VIRGAVVLAGLALLAVPAHGAVPRRASPPAEVVGSWLTEGADGVIAIAPCGDALCGRIIGIRRRPGEPMPRDVHGAPQCGLTILKDERPTAEGDWLGEITDPRDGRVYRAKLWLDARGRLRVRGFLGLPLFGQTQTWRRFTGTIGPECRIG
jgi:uncharacterized protein (DUF2147 family)